MGIPGLDVGGFVVGSGMLGMVVAVVDDMGTVVPVVDGMTIVVPVVDGIEVPVEFGAFTVVDVEPTEFRESVAALNAVICMTQAFEFCVPVAWYDPAEVTLRSSVRFANAVDRAWKSLPQPVIVSADAPPAKSRSLLFRVVAAPVLIAEPDPVAVFETSKMSDVATPVYSWM
jgi:hypothetical protein